MDRQTHRQTHRQTDSTEIITYPHTRMVITDIVVLEKITEVPVGCFLWPKRGSSIHLRYKIDQLKIYTIY